MALAALAGGLGLAPALAAQSALQPLHPAVRVAPPTRNPHTPGYVKALELPDGAVPPAAVNGNFLLGPTHPPAPETQLHPNVPHGSVYEFTISSTDSRIYPGIARDPGTFGTPDPANPAKLVVTTSHPAPYTRRVAVYVPSQYVPGTAAPFIVGADGPDPLLFTVLDNLIAEHKVPAMIAVSIGNGSGDAQGSERGLEYDTLSGKYAEFVETEVLPLVEKKYHVRLTHDPDGRATMGGSSGGACALIMAWYHPELYHRVLITPARRQSAVALQSANPARSLRVSRASDAQLAAKPIRIWMEVGDRDLYNPNVMRDDMHDWVVANEIWPGAGPKALPLSVCFARNAGHVDHAVKQQTLPEALEYLWRGYPAARGEKSAAGSAMSDSA